MRAITLDEIAEATKIGTRSLKALEDEHFDILPGGIFNRGFVRAYAKYLGIDEEQAVSDYLNAAGEQQPEKVVLPSEPITAQAEAVKSREALESVREKGSAGAWVAFALFLLLITGGSAGWKYYKQRQDAPRPIPQPEVTSTQTATPSATSVATDPSAVAPQDGAIAGQSPEGATGSVGEPAQGTATNPLTSQPAPGATQAGAKDKAPIELQISVTQPTWVSIKADGQAATTQTLRVSDQKLVLAQERVVVTTGNAVFVTCNGKSLGMVGESNRRSVLRFTSECVLQ